MKQVKAILFSFLIILVIASCGKNTSVDKMVFKAAGSYKLDKELFSLRNLMLEPLGSDKYVIFSDKGTLAVTDTTFNVIGSLKLEQGNGPGEFAFISSIGILDNEIMLYDFSLKRLMKFKYKEDYTLEYLETYNLDYSAFLGVGFIDDKILINSIIQIDNKQYLGVQLLDEDFDKYIKDIKVCDVGKSPKDLIMNIGWILIDEEYIYYIKIYQGEILKINYKNGEIIKTGIKDDKPIDMARLGENAAVLPPGILFDDLIVLPYNTKEHHLYCEFFDKDLNYVGYKLNEDIIGIPYFVNDKLFVLDINEFNMTEYELTP